LAIASVIEAFICSLLTGSYVDDKKAGDAAGDGKGGVWHIVRV
jgi:hypothetical protein